MRKIRKLLLAVLIGMPGISAWVSSPARAQEPARRHYLSKMASIGFPTWPYPKDAWKINELRIFNDRLYIGYGDYGVNTGPTDVLSCDLATGEFRKEFTVDEEAIDRYAVLDGKLAIPGVDATESWDFGNVYVLTDSGWRKHRSLTRALHVFDLASFRNVWYAGVGSTFDFAKGEQQAIGVVLASTDQGATWALEYSTPGDKNSVYRIPSLAVYQDRLYAFPYAYTALSRGDIPEAFQPYLGKPYVEGGKEYFLTFLSDPMGEADAVAYDGKDWKPLDLIPEPNVIRITPVVFQDRLILSVVFGTWVASLTDYVSEHKKLPPNASAGLYVYDGKEAKRMDFAFDRMVDLLVRGDQLFLLVLKEGRYGIAETRDLISWELYLLPQALEDPLSLEYDGYSFYIGMKDGNIFKTAVAESVPDMAPVRDYPPEKIFGGAELPRDGKRYWAAITRWQEWGKPATFSCEMEADHTIRATTRNVAGMSVFVPQGLLVSGKSMSLEIDSQEAFKGILHGRSELVCERSSRGIWKAHPVPGTAESFKPTRKVMGKSDVDLIRTGDDPSSGLWRAEVLRWAAHADIGLVNRDGAKKDLKRGTIHLEDLFDMSYRNSIRLFTVKGEKLRTLLARNLTLPEGNRVQVAGFEMTCQSFPDPKKNAIVSSSLEPQREYLVATYDYLVNEARDYFGEEIKAEDTGIREPEAMIQWLAEYKKIPPMKPRITVIRER